MKKETKENMEVQNDETLQAVQETAVGLAETDLEVATEELHDGRDNPVEAVQEDAGAAKKTKKKTKRKKRSRAKVSRRKKPVEEAEPIGSEDSDSVSDTAVQQPEDSQIDAVDDHAEMEATLEELSRELESAAELLGDVETSEPAEVQPVEADVSVSADEASLTEPVIADSDIQAEESTTKETSPTVVENEIADGVDSVEVAGTVDDSTVEAESDSVATEEMEQDVPAVIDPSASEDSSAEDVSPTVVENEIADGVDSVEVAATAGDSTVEAETDSVVTEEIESQVSAVVESPVTEESTKTVQEAVPTISPEPKPIYGDWDSGKRYARSLMVHHDRGGRIAEEYRAFRTNLLSKYPTDRFCLMVASAEAGEGKTVTCLNLAFALAERPDRRTIVVDYNLREGGVATLLKAKNTPGVTEVIQGQASLDEAIQPTAYTNLSFLSAGQVKSGQAGELMSRSELRSMVETLRDRYDYVLVDTPAVNHYSDAGITGLITGDALMVVRMNKTPKEAVRRAMQSLKATNVNVVGMLLTHRKRHLFN